MRLSNKNTLKNINLKILPQSISYFQIEREKNDSKSYYMRIAFSSIFFSFSMTLVDSLDTLAIIGDYDEFERAVKLVIDNVKLDNDIVISVFETNIRMVG